VSFDISRYHRWVKKNVLEKGVENIDYFNNRPSHIDENKRGKVRLLISIDFAEILCLQFGTERGKNFRLELLRYKYDFLNGKFDVDPIE
jgi:phage anti-repressor protein